MDFNIRVYKVDKEDSNLKGFVSITLCEEYCAETVSPGKYVFGNAEVPGL